MKAFIIGLVALIIIGGCGYLVLHKPPKPKAPTTNNSTTTSSVKNKAPAANPSSSTTQSTDTTTNQSQSSPLDVTVNANDDSSTPETINATKGQTVNITFAVSTNGTYHGGLEFKSTDPALDSGSIAEGSSKKVSFTATKSFKFTPYWYESNVQKDYFVTVNVN